MRKKILKQISKNSNVVRCKANVNTHKGVHVMAQRALNAEAWFNWIWIWNVAEGSTWWKDPYQFLQVVLQPPHLHHDMQIPIQMHIIKKLKSYMVAQKTKNSEYSIEGEEQGWRPGITQVQDFLYIKKSAQHWLRWWKNRQSDSRPMWISWLIFYKEKKNNIMGKKCLFNICWYIQTSTCSQMNLDIDLVSHKIIYPKWMTYLNANIKTWKPLEDASKENIGGLKYDFDTLGLISKARIHNWVTDNSDLLKHKIEYNFCLWIILSTEWEDEPQTNIFKHIL